MDVNSIVCCGFNKSYATLPKSRSGSLSNAQLYEAALFAYQNLVFQRHVDMEYSCISQADFDSFSQKLQGCCGCCGVDNNTDTEQTLAYQSCPVCFTVVGFTDDPQNDGIYADPDSEIIVVRDGGVFDPFFQVAGTGSIDGTLGAGGDRNWRYSVLITNPTSQYYNMVAVSSSDLTGTLESKIEIYDICGNPTPTLEASFPFGNIDFGSTIYGPLAYDYTNDRIYFTELGYRRVNYLDLSTGTYTFLFTEPQFGPFPNTYAIGVSINPATGKRYFPANGNLLYPPNAGGIGIYSSSNVLENVFPFDSIYTTPDPTIGNEFVSCAITFDTYGYTYLLSASNVSDYTPGYTQRDVIKLDPITNEVVTIFNYDPSNVWVPNTFNAGKEGRMYWYDGNGPINGEKLFVMYWNMGPVVTAGAPGGNGWGTATAARIVAFDTNAPYSSSVIVEIPFSTYGQVWTFTYSKQFNKFFFGGVNSQIIAYDVDGNEIYYEQIDPLLYGGYPYQFQNIPACDRIFALDGFTYPDPNLFVFEPVLTCPNGRISVIGEGTYEFNGAEWVPMVQTQNLSNFGNQWNVSAVFNQTAVQAKLQYSTNLISWTDIEPVTGGLYHDATAWSSGLVFVLNTEDDVWFRIAIVNDDDCLTYGEIFPEPPPIPNFESDPLTVYRYNDVQYTDLSVGVPQSWAWTFEGGIPSTSTQENPLITYETAGVFDTTLAVTNVNGTLSKTASNYVTVNEGLLLNYIPGSSVGYSLRKINITYGGPCIRVRRDSDNIEQDINFINGELDVAALDVFCGVDGSNGYVVVWYDQSGLGNDLTQFIGSSQPQIVSSGVTILENGKPCIIFDGVDDSMAMTSSVVVTAMSTSIVASPTLNTGVRPLVGTALANQITVAGSFGMGIAGSSQFDTFNPSTSPNQGSFIYHRNGLANPNTLRSAYRNGVQLTQAFALLTNQTATYTALAGASGANRFGGKIQEVIIWNGYKASKNGLIQSNTNGYFNIY